MTLKVGIIGCGGIANGKHMPSLLKAEKAEMVAFCDNVLEKAEANDKRIWWRKCKRIHKLCRITPR